MASDFIYLHLDTISNSLFARGLAVDDFSASLLEVPEHILLLDANETEGEYEPHTGLRVVRGKTAVTRYFFQKSKQNDAQLKWLDFKDLDLLQQVTPMEIAELLYFGHMMSQLRSPFFYKLQNKYVYFEKPGDITKVYYRRMEDFYRLISHKISDVVFQKINKRKGLFKATINISPIDPEVIKELKVSFQEGVILDTRQTYLLNDLYVIPLYLGDDRVKVIDGRHLKEENRVGEISYDLSTDNWDISILDPWVSSTIKKD